MTPFWDERAIVRSVVKIGRGEPSTARLTQPTDKIELFHLSSERIFEKAAPLYRSGGSLREIARELGIPKTPVRKTLIDHGLVCRLSNSDRQSSVPLVRRLHVGVAPYGHCTVQGKLLEVPKEQEVIRIIMKLRSANKNLSAIARYLNKHNFKPRKAKQWDHSSIRSIVKRQPTSIGGSQQ